YPGIPGQVFDVADEILPGLASVSRQLNIAVVSSNPNQVGVLWRFTNRKDRRVHFGRGIVHRDAARLFLLLFFGIVGRQIGRDALPCLTVIAGAKQKLRADVDRPALRRTEVNWCVPVIAKFAFFIIGQGLNAARFVGLSVDASDVAAL